MIPKPSKSVPFIFVTVLLAVPALGQYSPETLNYQGRLTDNVSQTPVDGVVSMSFSIWDSASVGTGTWFWQEDWSVTGVTVYNGIFNVVLGTSPDGPVPIPASIFTSGTSRYLEITVNGETLQPRQELTSVGWAHQAEEAAWAGLAGSAASAGLANLASDVDCTNCIDSSEVQFNYAGSSSAGGPANDLSCANCIDDSDISDDISINNGLLFAASGAASVGIGTTGPVSRLHVVDGNASDDTPAIHGVHAVTDGSGVGVQGTGRWRGVHGTATTAAGSATGVRADADGAGTGGRYGLYATASGGDESFAGYFEGNLAVMSGGRVGIGTKTPNVPLHVVGDASSIVGAHFDTTASSLGVGLSADGQLAGVIATADAPAGNIKGLQVEAKGAGTGTRYGLYATASGGDTAYAGFFDGDTQVDGSLAVVNGNVGIGTTSPNSPLELRGTLTTNWGFTIQHYEPGYPAAHQTLPMLRKSWSGTYGDYLYFGPTGNRPNTEQTALLLTEDDGMSIGKGTDAGNGLSSTFIRVTNSGDVGFGTTSPTHQVDINGGTDSLRVRGGAVIDDDLTVYGDIGWSATASAISIPTAAFRQLDGMSTPIEKVEYIEGTTVGFLSVGIAPVSLPHGATLTGATLHYAQFGNSGAGNSYVRADVYARDMATDVETWIEGAEDEACSSCSSGWTNRSATNNSAPDVIDNLNNTYYVKLTMNNGGRYRALTLHYTTTGP